MCLSTMLSVRLLLNSRLLVFSGESKVIHGFSIMQGFSTPTTALLKGQL